MAKLVPKEKALRVRKTVYDKADAYGYATRSRNDNGLFMDNLLEDSEVGGILKEYMPKSKIRTYIKDSILNAYAKNRAKKILTAKSPENIVLQVFSVRSFIIQEGKGKDSGVSVCRAEDGRIFVISEGTVLKWETALRKALELIAREPKLIINGKTPQICLQLAALSADITDGEKAHIATALDAISVKAQFCGG